MSAWWLLLIVPGAIALGVVGALAWFAHEFYKGWR